MDEAFSEERVDRLSLTLFSLLHVALLLAAIALAELSRLLRGWLPLVLYATLTLAAAAYVLLYYLDAVLRENEALDERRTDHGLDAPFDMADAGGAYASREGAAMSVTVVATGLLAMTILWGLLMREVMQANPGAFGGIALAPGEDVSRWTGIGFAFDNLLRALPLDVQSALGFTFSGVAAQGGGARALGFAYRLAFDVIILMAILTQWRLHRLMRRREAALREREETRAARGPGWHAQSRTRPTRRRGDGL